MSALDLRQIIEKLVQPGFVIRTDDLGGYDGYELRVERVESYLLGVRLEQLLQEGWIEPNGISSWKLSDKGRAAYIRSTDELGDGVLRAPSETREGALPPRADPCPHGIRLPHECKECADQDWRALNTGDATSDVAKPEGAV